MDSKAAFLHAHEVLMYCREQQINASAELFPDGSGRLIIHNAGSTAGLHQTEIAYFEAQLHSNRWRPEGNGKISLSSCHGWHP